MPLDVITAKYKSIRASIEKDIRRGRYGPSQRLPTEKEMALLFGVSYMTARRAITELVEADLLERRAGSGIFVRPISTEKLSKFRVNIICDSGDAGPLSRRFQMLACQYAEAMGWRPHVVHFENDYYRSAEQALRSGDPAIALIGETNAEGPLNSSLRRAADRVVLVGSRMKGTTIPSVMADDALGIRMAVERLKAVGHRRIGLITYNSKESLVQAMVQSWRSCFPAATDEEIQRRYIAIYHQRSVRNSEQTYIDVAEYFRRELDRRDDGITALVVYLIEDRMHAVLAACRDSGRDVPGKMSLICYGCSSELAYAYPPVTFIDNNLEQHLELATEMLKSLIDGTLSEKDREQTVMPRLVERQSVAPVA